MVLPNLTSNDGASRAGVSDINVRCDTNVRWKSLISSHCTRENSLGRPLLEKRTYRPCLRRPTRSEMDRMPVSARYTGRGTAMRPRSFLISREGGYPLFQPPIAVSMRCYCGLSYLGQADALRVTQTTCLIGSVRRVELMIHNKRGSLSAS